MTDNMRKFMESLSADKEFADKVRNAGTGEMVIELAKEKGFNLTDDDFKQESGPISDEEVEAVTGGSACICVGGGGGEASADRMGQNYDEVCACVAIGWGNDGYGNTRCACCGGGGGECSLTNVEPDY